LGYSSFIAFRTEGNTSVIRKLLLSSVALAAISGTAFAADLPSRRAPPVYAPPAIPVFSWTGFYIGGQVGYRFGSDRAVVTDVLGTTGYGTKPNGIVGGAHVGYNFSTQSLFGNAFGTGTVIGIEGDVDGSDYRRVNNTGAFGAPLTVTENIRSNLTGSVRGRLGFTFDRALFYATGGVAFAQYNTNYGTGAAAAVTGNLDSLSKSRVGWTAGAGVEYAITNNWSLRLEYRYSDYGTFTDFAPVTLGGTTVSHRETDNKVQAGFSYKFDTFAPAAPVVARY
jgi:outer membrane immunogenic protein